VTLVSEGVGLETALDLDLYIVSHIMDMAQIMACLLAEMRAN
jgi:hypothetical protein